MEILGYVLALFIGFSLGLLGGGGSILTVPILVYVVGIAPILATGYSLFVVGSTAAIGAYKKYQQGLVQVKSALLFGAPSLIMVFVTRRFILPIIPETIYSFKHFLLTKDLLIMLLFAVIMLAASFKMISKAKKVKINRFKESTPKMVILYGLFIGFITAFVGAGGGFLIVPALVLLLQVPVKKAVGTSLLIIAINSGVGFIGDLSVGRNINWWFLLIFSTISIIGLFLGVYATKFVEGAKLKKAFGWFVLVMAFIIIITELYTKTKL